MKLPTLNYEFQTKFGNKTLIISNDHELKLLIEAERAKAILENYNINRKYDMRHTILNIFLIIAINAFFYFSFR